MKEGRVVGENRLRLKGRWKVRGIQFESSVGPNLAEIEKSWVAYIPRIGGVLITVVTTVIPQWPRGLR